MYRDDTQRINKLRLVAKIVLGIIVLLLLIKLITLIINPSKQEKNLFDANLKKMSKYASEYFRDSQVDIEIGKNKKYILKDLKGSSTLFKKDDECSLKDSYVLVTRLDDEYQVKSYLTCKDQNDYKVTYVEAINKEESTTKKTTKKVRKKEEKKTTKKVNKTIKVNKKSTTKKVVKAVVNKKTYTVSFNVNGGKIIDTFTIDEGSKIPYVKPVRPGYTFVGWYLDGTEYNFDNKVNSNIVLTAKWIMN